METILNEHTERKIKNLLMNFIKIKSHTKTVLERDIEKYLLERLQEMDYFKSNSMNLGVYPLKNDALERSVIWGLVKGKGKKTVILVHHHDTVDTDDYHTLREWAYNPDLLAEKLRDIELTKEVRDDLESGEWIFARGSADMKAGMAIQTVLLEEFSKQEEVEGNILLLSVPDEENLSWGMRSSVALLEELKERFDLDYILLIDSETHLREEMNTGIFHTGSVGKMLPVVYVRGRKTHSGDIFQGFNPVVLLSQIAIETELNTNFSDVVEDAVSPPPSWSFFRDDKRFYDASIPEAAGGYFSILTLKKTPKVVMEQLEEICTQAFESVICRMNKSFSHYQEMGNRSGEKLLWKTNVKTFAQIFKEAIDQSGEKFLDDYRLTIEKLKVDIDNAAISIPESNLALISKTLEYISDKTPVVVIAISPPYYPHVSLDDFKHQDLTGLDKVIKEIANKVCNETYKKSGYYFGLSDMSYTALNNSEEIIPHIKSNMPLFENIYDFPCEGMKRLSIPSINIGPWGKDLHKFTERVLEKDLVRQTPKLLEGVIQHILKNG